MTDLRDEDPEEQWPPELREATQKAAEHQERFAWWYLPQRALRRRLERQIHQLPAWRAEHYEDWSREALVWRIRFLQEAGRSLHLEQVILRRYLLPVWLFGALLLGLLLGKL